MSLIDKRKRELEIAANFEKVLNHLPVDFFNSIKKSIIDYNNTEDERMDSCIGSSTERCIFGEGDPRRADLVFNFSPVISKIVFEFKLGKENQEQVIGYADSCNNSLIVSVAKEVKKISDSRIVQLTWNDLFNGLLKIASSEVREKLIPLDLIENFSPGFPDRRLGEPALAFLEDFLFTIKKENLVAFKGKRVMIVTGKMASRTTQNHNVYWFGTNWDKDFQYLVVVNESQIQYVGEVTERYFRLENLAEISNKGHRDLIAEAFNDEVNDKFYGQPILILKSLSNNNNIGLKYIERGAITQSHRYFDDLELVYKQFKSE